MNETSKTKKGFTLIELLVVISIISVLSSIIIVSLQTSRNRANDVKVKQNLAQVQRAAEVFYANQVPPSYGESFIPQNCPITSISIENNMFEDEVTGMNNLVSLNNFPPNTTINCTVAEGGSAYAISASLSGSNKFWCVSSTDGPIERSSHISGSVCGS